MPLIKTDGSQKTGHMCMSTCVRRKGIVGSIQDTFVLLHFVQTVAE